MKKNSIVYLNRSQLEMHPDNPRKNLGDLEELRESIRANGIMQNLTVIPTDDSFDHFRILIGHRRYAASEGILSELPCVIVEGLSNREQVGIMLCENLQRNDLTYYEQGRGFQMMMDLGDTIDEIADKTGFSKTTIKHRVEIAKLSKKTLEQKRTWQISLGDLIELEKLDSIKEREKILKEARDSDNLRTRVNYAIMEKNQNNNLKVAKKWFKTLGIMEETKNQNARFSNDYEQLLSVDLRNQTPKNFSEDKFKKLAAKDKNIVWQEAWGTLYILKKKKRNCPSKQKTKAELEQEARSKKKKEIKAVHEAACMSYARFMLDLPDDVAIKTASSLGIEALVWEEILKCRAVLDSYKAVDVFPGYEERNQFYEKTLFTWPTVLQMLFILTVNLFGMDLLDWNFELQQETVDLHVFMIASLEKFGYDLPEDIPLDVLDGTSEMYKGEK